MTTLTKDTAFTGNFGLPGTPGSAGSPPTSYVECRTEQPISITVVTDDSGHSQTIISYGPARQVCETRTTPGTPATPPTPGQAPDLTEMYNLGWNSGGVSVAQIIADGTYSFTAPMGVTGIVTGLNDENAGSASYGNIDHALYVTQDMVIVIERGVQMTAATLRTAADVFRVQRAGFTITYWKNNTLIYTSLLPSYGPAFADVSMYRGGDAVVSATLEDTATRGARGGGANVALEALDCFIARPGYGASSVKFRPLSTTLNFRLWQGTTATLLPLGGFVTNKPYADARATFEPMGADHDRRDSLTPSYALVAAAIAPLLGSGYMLTGQTNTSTTPRFEALDGFASNKSYGESAVSFKPLESLTGYVGAFSYADLRFTQPFAVRAEGDPTAANAFRGTMPMAFVAYGGAQARMTMPRPTMLATGVGTVVGRAYLEPGSFTVYATGTAGGLGRASMVLDGMDVIAYSGAVVSITLHDGFTVYATGKTGAAGRVVVEMGLFELVASGTVRGINGAEITLPPLSPVPSAIARLIPEGFHVLAVGTATVAVALDDYEAYTLNLVDRKVKNPNEEIVHEVTRYTNYPFSQIVRFKGKYYGVGATGLYLLEGDDDAGQPIAWDAVTCDTDFDTHNHKTVVSAYMNGVLHEGMTVRVTANRDVTHEYDYATPRGHEPQNHRQKFGKGVKATHYSFQFTDSQGRQFRLNNCEFEIGTMKRAI